MPLGLCFVQNRTELDSHGLDRRPVGPEPQGELANAWPPHIIRTSLDVLAERHF